MESLEMEILRDALVNTKESDSLVGFSKSPYGPYNILILSDDQVFILITDDEKPYSWSQVVALSNVGKENLPDVLEYFDSFGTNVLKGRKLLDAIDLVQNAGPLEKPAHYCYGE